MAQEHYLRASDADFAALLTAYQNRTMVEFAFADGVIATSGTKYFRIECKLFEFSRNEALEDAKKLGTDAGEQLLKKAGKDFLKT